MLILENKDKKICLAYQKGVNFVINNILANLSKIDKAELKSELEWALEKSTERINELEKKGK